jgi:hypothetical protein
MSKSFGGYQFARWLHYIIPGEELYLAYLGKHIGLAIGGVQISSMRRGIDAAWDNYGIHRTARQ